MHQVTVTTMVLSKKYTDVCTDPPSPWGSFAWPSLQARTTKHDVSLRGVECSSGGRTPAMASCEGILSRDSPHQESGRLVQISTRAPYCNKLKLWCLLPRSVLFASLSQVFFSRSLCASAATDRAFVCPSPWYCLLVPLIS